MSPSHALTLVAATRSRHKLDEIRRILGKDAGLRILSLDEAGIPFSTEEDKIEVFDTLEENAKAKAAYFNSLCGAATIADDSGLEVDILDGAPGVRSKRFAPAPDLGGEDRDHANNEHLVKLLSSHKPHRRTGRFVCVAVLHFGMGEPLVFRGEAPGSIVLEPRGKVDSDMIRTSSTPRQTGRSPNSIPRRRMPAVIEGEPSGSWLTSARNSPLLATRRRTPSGIRAAKHPRWNALLCIGFRPTRGRVGY